MSAIASQFAAGVKQSMTQLGVTAIYTRSDTAATVSLTVILATPEYQIVNDSGAVMLAANQWDVLLMTDDLVFGGSAYEPKAGDKMEVGGVTYVVTVDEGRRYCWTWADKYRIRRRLFAKITSGE